MAARSCPGKFKGRDVTVVDVFEGVGQYRRRQDAVPRSRANWKNIACPGAGACGGQFTANTMACVAEAIGLALPYSSGPPAEVLARDDFALKAGQAVMTLVEKHLVRATSARAQGVRECGHGRGGHRRFDQCGAASARDGE